MQGEWCRISIALLIQSIDRSLFIRLIVIQLVDYYSFESGGDVSGHSAKLCKRWR